FKNHIKEEEDNEFTLPIIMRERTGNQFQSFIRRDTSSYYRDVPFHYNPKLITEILSDTLGREIHYTDSVLPADYEVLHSIPADTLFRRMLLPSDNFIAEQILLNISMSLFGEMNTDKVIQLISDKYLKELPDRPRWVDGSGLSRYNLFTPRSIVQLLIMIDREVDDDGRLFSLLPAGGVTGTLQNSYRHPDGTGPWVFAKTGTLSNNHSLSGFIITKSGKKLIFSFMNNNYMVPASSIRSEMERILWTVHNAM
ncbi:MAG: D-alanyl-D-alanine carboxypeptidase, partial [Balneolaceae bacterium]